LFDARHGNAFSGKLSENRIVPTAYDEIAQSGKRRWWNNGTDKTNSDNHSRLQLPGVPEGRLKIAQRFIAGKAIIIMMKVP